MKRMRIVLVMACIALASLAASSLLMPRFAGPVSVSFLGYTNHPAGSEAARAIDNESEAIFELTSHTASRLRCTFTFDALNSGSGLTSTSSGECSLPGRAARTLSMVVPGSANGWRFQTVISASGSRPYWQQCIGRLLGRIGLHPLSLASDKAYPQLTNVWSKP